MKRIVLLGSLLLSACMLSAQSRYVEIEGLQERDGGMVYNRPHTMLAVDLTVECETVKAGPYARYALKYLGLRAPFSDKTIHTLRGADVALFDENGFVAAPLAADESRTVSYGDEGGEFAVLSVDRTEIIQPSAEQAAEQAANRIFALRRSRLDLITGEAGENVFGEGLKAALAAIDSQEQALLELFLGKRTVTTETRRVLVAPRPAERRYIVARFSESDGLLPESDLSGEMILLEITPGEPFAIEAAPEKSSDVVVCRVAAPSVCAVRTGNSLLAERTLPLFEFGTSVRVQLPRRK